MGLFLVYIFKSSICLTVFYLFYRLLLSKETFHHFNRWALLSVLVLSALLPFVEITIQHPTEMQQTMLNMEQLFFMATKDELSDEDSLAFQHINVLVSVCWWIYIIGIIFFIGRNLFSLIKLSHLLRISRSEKIKKYLPEYKGKAILCVHNKSIAPFSWLYFVVISHNDLQQNSREILIHELAHIRKCHSWDLFGADCSIFLQWFNPAAWLIKQELQNVHEYEADESVLKEGVNAKQYQLLIIKKAVGTRLYSMANSLNHSSLKKRITMMMKEKSNPWARLKYLYILPVAAITVTAFARPEISSVANEISNAKISDLKSIIEIKSSVNDDTVKYVPVSQDVKEKLNGNVYSVVNEMPQYPNGGMSGLKKYIYEHLKYPESAKKEGKQGRVVVQFIVNQDGSLSDFTLLRSLDPELDAAAIQVFMGMPKWIPGMQDGVPVPVKYTIPVNFTLPSDAANNQTVSEDRNEKDDFVIMVDGKVISKEAFEAIDLSQIQSFKIIKEALPIDTEDEQKKKKIIQVVLKKEGKPIVEVEEMQAKGVVVDESGNPIIGAIVSVLGTQVGTVTGLDGEFNLKVPQDAILQVSYIGVGTEKVKVQPVMKVTLKVEK